MRWNPNIVNVRGPNGAFEFFHSFGGGSDGYGYSGWMSSYGLSHWDGSPSFYNSAYDDYNEISSHLTRDAGGALGMGFGVSPQNTRGQCPKSAEDIMGNRKIKAELVVAFGLSGHRTDNPIEQGGWVYQNRRGGLEFIRANPDERSTSGRIDLSNPPSLPGAFLVATYHAHPYSEADANYMLTPTNRMGPSDVDENLAYRQGVPGLVIYEKGPPENGKLNLSITYVGPNRMGGAPNRAKPPADGFPGNSVDYRDCL